MDEQALNRKLAEWAGNIKHNWNNEIAGYRTSGCFCWNCFDSEDYTPSKCIPNFTQSLDACFKRLVPKLEPLGYDLEISNDDQMFGWRVSLHNQHSECSIASPYEQFSEPSDTALALCLAIEKLIDSEMKSRSCL